MKFILLFLIAIFSSSIWAIDFPYSTDLYPNSPNAPKSWSYNSHKASVYQNRYYELLKKRANNIYQVDRLGGEIIQGQSGQISSISEYFTDWALPPLTGITRKLEFSSEENKSLFKEWIDTLFEFVYEGFSEEGLRREVLSLSFIEKLRAEDKSLPLERTQLISFTNIGYDSLGKTSKWALAGELAAVIGLFDGQVNPIINSKPHLPVETKYKDLVLPERLTHSKVLEIKRLFSNSIKGEEIARVLGEHLIQVEKTDFTIYAHTDRLGSRLFKNNYGFKPYMKFEDGTYLLKILAEKFIQKHVPKEILRRYRSVSCRRLFI
jgi:hypothetical protein